VPRARRLPMMGIFDRCVVCVVGEQRCRGGLGIEVYRPQPWCSVCGRRLTNAEFFEPVLFRQSCCLWARATTNHPRDR